MFRLLLEVDFAKSKSINLNFQTVAMQSEVYAWNDTPQEFEAKYEMDFVMQSHRHLFMLNAFNHGTWAECLQCPAVQPGAAALPFLPIVDGHGMPTFQRVPLVRVQRLFAAVALAAGYEDVTAHGSRSGMAYSLAVRGIIKHGSFTEYVRWHVHTVMGWEINSPMMQRYFRSSFALFLQADIVGASRV
ncbi:hypothetical protein GPECTOR_519g499 [Gonium pectorale]|uniref:Uncharacterized protein n=1 Tax=Gonium pectorale TaxID=33097 RepID=A0A150FVY6_GONPE|nr:hypothetical protein GPECTOR_519g499 [Gonium pectorale]|eukprot:KXZ41365.1 hypothetical protein GPECTOR_519g499 [Gonium pectorale]